MPISATEVKTLRDKTGAGFMDCKSALTAAGGDLDQLHLQSRSERFGIDGAGFHLVRRFVPSSWDDPRGQHVLREGQSEFGKVDHAIVIQVERRHEPVDLWRRQIRKTEIVEPLIALSIVYVGFENMMTKDLKRWRPILVFVFGLLH